MPYQSFGYNNNGVILNETHVQTYNIHLKIKKYELNCKYLTKIRNNNDIIPTYDMKPNDHNQPVLFRPVEHG